MSNPLHKTKSVEDTAKHLLQAFSNKPGLARAEARKRTNIAVSKDTQDFYKRVRDTIQARSKKPDGNA